jgi:class 3 adenylate cyclase/CHASE2 domain-containing sensor protein
MVLFRHVEQTSIRQKQIREFSIFNLLENVSRDFIMRFRATISRSTGRDANYSGKQYSDNVSEDIILVGIDEKSLNEIGRWPFRRHVHGKLADFFGSMKYPPNTLFYDIFFVEPDVNNPEDDSQFIDAVKRNGSVVFDYIGRDSYYSSASEKADMDIRFDFKKEKFGTITRVSGSFNEAKVFYGMTMPLVPYIDAIEGTGYANSIEDMDKIVRRYPLVARYVERDMEKPFTSLQEGIEYDQVVARRFEIVFDRQKGKYSLKQVNAPALFSQVHLPVSERSPLTSNDITSIKAKVEKFESDFAIELEQVQARVVASNKEIIDQILTYLDSSSMPATMKEDVRAVLGEESMIRELDLILQEWSKQFKTVAESDKTWKKDAAFFGKMNEKVYKIDRTGKVKAIEKGKVVKYSLYDYLFKNRVMKFEELIAQKDHFVMSIALLLVSRYYHVPVNEIEVIFGKEIRLHNPKRIDQATGELQSLGREYISIPVTKEGYLYINYAGWRSSTLRDIENTTFDTWSYSELLSSKGILARDKIIMVGAFAKGMADDAYQTPFKTMYGLEIIANTVNTALTGEFIVMLPVWAYLLILLGIALVTGLIASNRNILRAYLYTMLMLFAYSVLAALLFYFYNIALEIPKALMVSLLSFVSVIVYRVFTEQKQKKAIKNIFSKYVSADVVEDLLISPPELGGVDKDLTVFFSDIRGFTTLSEKLTPQELVSVLNRYLTAMTDLIMEYHGTLDKYIGDAIMCFWGAPRPQDDHAALACSCALKQIEILREINADLPEDLNIDIGIGLNSGIMTVGNMGSEGRMNYTLMGDNVNLGSRLEGTNKAYGTTIIISENTYNLVKDQFIIRELDSIKVKGKTKPVTIYELLAEKEASA